MTGDHLYRMSHLSQTLHDFRRYALLHRDNCTLNLTIISRHSFTYAKPRCIKGLLWIHAKYVLIQEHLYVALRLHKSTHNTKHRSQTTVINICGYGWNYGVIGAFSRSISVGMSFLETEVCTSVLECESTSGRHYCRTKTCIIAVDK